MTRSDLKLQIVGNILCGLLIFVENPHNVIGQFASTLLILGSLPAAYWLWKTKES